MRNADMPDAPSYLQSKTHKPLLAASSKHDPDVGGGETPSPGFLPILNRAVNRAMVVKASVCTADVV